jgi:TPR repeat protein
VTLLSSNQYAELERRFSAIQLGYEHGAITDENLRAAFRAFYGTDAALEPKYDAWVAQFPKSYVARLARGIYYKKVGEERRGSNFISSTTDDQLRGMEAAFVKASRDLHDSVALDDKPLLSYLHAMDIASFHGDSDESREILDASLKLDPGNFIVPEKYMGFLKPRWGGSAEEMYAFLEKCRQAGLSAAHLQSLEGIIVEDQAAIHRDAGDYAAAERDYRRAAAMGRDECLPCLADVLSKQRKFADAIPLYSKLLASSPADASALSSRAYAYLHIGMNRESLADWTAAAGYGSAYAQNELGVLNMTGIPGLMAPNPDAGVSWFRKAAAQGNLEGIRNLQTALGGSGTAARP